MEDFKSKYLTRCGELGINPITELVNLFNKSDRKDTAILSLETLNLSAVSMNLKTISALSAGLFENSFFTKLILADTFLGDDGCIKLATSLKTNSSVIHLDLRGNSIRSEGAVALGNLLKVNSTIKHLFLEWNCIGIWDSGVKAISEALTLNESLETLDLRNNKIGPQSSQNLALCLKHNTSLRKLDLRWNNCGLLGGRAFVDLLQWNRTIIDLELTGNEIPEETLRGISSGIDRNFDRYNNQKHTKAHSEALSSTIQTLTMNHQEAMLELQTRYAKQGEHTETLRDKLNNASSEIQNMQDIYRDSQTKFERLETEYKKLQELLTQERTDLHQQLNDRQKDLNKERENRSQAEEKFQRQFLTLNEQVLSLDSKLKNALLEIQVLSRDKSSLLEELDLVKEKEKKVNQLWEGKMERANVASKNKLIELVELKDQEFGQKVKKFEERIKIIEAERARAEEENDSAKMKFMVEKRNWVNLQAELENRLKKDEEARIKDYENKVKIMASHNQSLQEELDANNKRNSSLRRDLEAEIKRLCDEKITIQEEISNLQTQGMRHALELKNLKLKLDDTKTLELELASKRMEITKLLEQISKDKIQSDNLQASITQRNTLISKLKEELKKRDSELDAKDEETALRMKELQMSINQLLVARKPRMRSHELVELEIS